METASTNRKTSTPLMENNKPMNGISQAVDLNEDLNETPNLNGNLNEDLNGTPNLNGNLNGILNGDLNGGQPNKP